MAHDNKSLNDNPDRLRAENEEKKKKLTEEQGAYFSDMTNETDLPPEIESQFLDHIMAFENAFQTNKRILLYDFLDKPSYRKAEEMNDEEVTEELNRMLELMNNKMVSLDTICEVDDRELYRFITEELFLEEKDDIHIPGMFTHYIYEEFHPNHEYDIRNHSTDFIRSYLDKENDFYLHLLTSETEKADWHVHFRQAFSSFQLNGFSITELKFDAENATVRFDCDFSGKVEGSVESLHFIGSGELTLLYQWDYWCVDKVNLPQSTFC